MPVRKITLEVDGQPRVITAEIPDGATQDDILQAVQAYLRPPTTMAGHAKEFVKGALDAIPRGVAEVDRGLNTIPGMETVRNVLGYTNPMLIPERITSALAKQYKGSGAQQALAANPGYEDSLARGTGSVVGGSVPYLAAGMLGPAAIPVMAGLGGAQGAGSQAENIDRMREQGADISKGQEYAAEALGGGLGAAQALALGRLAAPVQRLAGILPGAEQAGLGQLARSAASQAGLMGTAGGVGQVANNAIEQIYNPKKDLTEGWLQAALTGALGGAALDAGLGLANRVAFNRPTKSAPERTALSEAVKSEEPLLRASSQEAPAIQESEIPHLAKTDQAQLQEVSPAGKESPTAEIAFEPNPPAYRANWGKPKLRGKAMDEAQANLEGGFYRSYGGGIDEILKVAKTDTGYDYTVRDVKTGEKRTHSTFIDPRKVQVPLDVQLARLRAENEALKAARPAEAAALDQPIVSASEEIVPEASSAQPAPKVPEGIPADASSPESRPQDQALSGKSIDEAVPQLKSTEPSKSNEQRLLDVSTSSQPQLIPQKSAASSALKPQPAVPASEAPARKVEDYRVAEVAEPPQSPGGRQVDALRDQRAASNLGGRQEVPQPNSISAEQRLLNVVPDPQGTGPRKTIEQMRAESGLAPEQFDDAFHKLVADDKISGSRADVPTEEALKRGYITYGDYVNDPKTGRPYVSVSKTEPIKGEPNGDIVKLNDEGTGTVEGRQAPGSGDEGEGSAKNTEEVTHAPADLILGGGLGALETPVKEFVKQDVVPRAVETAVNVKDALREATSVLMPDMLGKQADDAGRILRRNRGNMDRAYAQAEEGLQAARNDFRARPAQENYDFIDRVENGQPQPNAKDQGISAALREMLDDRRKQVQDLGTGKLEKFYEDYFPHIWEDPKKASDVFSQLFAKRPFEGSKAFLKKRTYATFKEGLDAGLKPISDNPVDMVLLKVREMDRYIMAHKTLQEYKSTGLAKFVRDGVKPEAGWAKIDDRIATVYGPRTDQGATVIRGHYYMPTDAARIINNYLSPSLRSKSGMFRTALGLNNAMNQMQLGLSAFHAAFTSAEAAISRMTLGMEQLMRGDFKQGAKTIASTPAAPITNVLQGNKLLKAYFEPSGAGGDLAKIADAVARSGGRVRLSLEYQNMATKGLVDAWAKGNVIGAALRLPGAVLEKTAAPIMEYLVPRQKLGVFYDQAKYALERLGPNASKAVVEKELQSIWDSVDNRMGQLVYDNLFWHNYTKDAAMLLTRSVGWNLGTLREVGGGLADLYRQPRNALKGEPVNLRRIAYLGSLVTVHATMAAIYQYLSTGEGPKELKDYSFPRNGELDETGRPMRMSMPTYLKDVYHYGMEPWKTLANKLGPLPQMLSDMIHNKDFYGVEIRHKNDPLVAQLGEMATYIAKQQIPFGLRNLERQNEKGGSAAVKAQGFFGITPAPAIVNKTPAERLASDLLGEQMPQDSRTQQEFDRAKAKRMVTQATRIKAEMPPFVQDQIQAGNLSSADLKDARKNARYSPLQLQVRRLDLDKALQVYELASDEEKAAIRPILQTKRNHLNNKPQALSEPLERRMKELTQ